MSSEANNSEKTLIVVTGPTASGKTRLAVELASILGTEIISADSRQIFRDIPVVTAQPSLEERCGIPHHLIGFLGLKDYYSAAVFEEDALRIAERIWEKSPFAIMCGGSMMYVDAVVKGLDHLPTISESVRSHVMDLYLSSGLDPVRKQLKALDPVMYERVDLDNYRRVIHALEICLESGMPASSFLGKRKVNRPFRIIKVMIGRNRDDLFRRINSRVDAMMQAGLEEEARSVEKFRGENSVNTVGLKEMFAYFDGKLSRESAVARIAKNTRVYAKKQLTWLARDPLLQIVDDNPQSIINLL